MAQRIIIVVNKGIVECIYSDDDMLYYSILDYDILGNGASDEDVAEIRKLEEEAKHLREM